ncbi:MAG: YigZ family protein [Thermomicrobiales bacterium]
MTDCHKPDTYLTIAGPARSEMTVKASRFIGEAMPVGTVEDAEAQIDIIRKREYNASHHCFAYRLGHDRETFRYSDDGEPNGTGGPPILRHIDGRELTNILVVVTRYYGGTNLGTGGLIRAYGDAAGALDAARTVTRILRERVSLRFQYDDTSPAMHTIGQFDAPIIDTRYSEETEIIVNVRQAEATALCAAFTTALAGRGVTTRLDAESDVESDP